MLKQIALCAAMFVAVTGAHAEDTPAAASDFDSSIMVTLLDMKAPTADRHTALAALKQHAEAGNSFAMYDLGSLVHQTRFKDDAVIRPDPGAALMWLTRAFDNGRFTAAFKLATVHRELGDHLEAMAWLQVYTYYWKGGNRTAQRSLPTSGAAAWLMARLQAELKSVPEESIRQRTIALLEAHGTKFEQAPATPSDSAEGCDVRPPPKGFRFDGSRRHDPSIVELVARIAPDGSASESFVMDSVPDPMAAKMARQFAFAIRCPEVSADSPERHAFILFNYRGTDPYRSRGRESRSE
ncbi:hypothetical protein C7S18_10700 [Ahniella affigens]|uniref:Sel1 repeat family protein n=1 Tax=Ahniella affigens TaxID=2021234 RepID=A0A2P1PS28_9GAMM|nr:hypothetical protein [Ahniella affigens]AVP97638.1 hypothetical protein C7S18_10700 [Ahniella affigens]